MPVFLTISFMFDRVLLNFNTRGIRFELALLGLGVSNDSLSIADSHSKCLSKN